MKENSFCKYLIHIKVNYSVIAIAFFILGSCATIPVRREIKRVEEISTISPLNKYIKAHMKDGTLYILYDWLFNEFDNSVTGHGIYMDINRNILASSGNLKSRSDTRDEPFKVCISDIALFETNDPGPSLVAGLTIVTGITAGVTIYCLINPKACFGSCPTFYAQDGDSMTLQAEGFSASISPSLEKSDIDMLYSAKPTRDFNLVVTNEALETHSIRHANLLVFEKKDEERIFASPDESFYRCTNISQPFKCLSISGDCLKKVINADGDEYFSCTDSSNLDSKEELILNFTSDNNKKTGLIIGKRQTLLTTFLMYQGLAYMGHSVTYWMAELEGGKIEKKKGIFDLLGGIEVYSKDSAGNWKYEGSINETGPIATDFNVIPLSIGGSGNAEIKIILNRGLWRIDYLALATLSEKVLPVVIEPSSVETIKGLEANPLQKLKNSNEYLVTYPGDKYRISYSLPFNNAELFLDSKGYYLEWIRDEWVKEQNFRHLNLMINKPAQFLRKSAGEFKNLEPRMEETFWKSRYAKN
jgi:hypothetical protein